MNPIDLALVALGSIGVSLGVLAIVAWIIQSELDKQAATLRRLLENTDGLGRDLSDLERDLGELTCRVEGRPN